MYLPFDIWLHIASFLPASQLRNLYGVNHALFDISMDERYKEIFFDHRSVMTGSRKLKLLKDLNATRRVRTLYMRPPVIPQLSPKSAVLKRAVHRYKVAKTTETMLQAIHGMSNVKEMTLCSWEYLGLPDLISFLPVILAGWTVFGATLRSLTLDVSLEGYCHVLTPSMVFLRLEELTLRLSVTYLTTNTTKIVCDLLVPFVNSHHSTLQSFYLSSDDLCDISPFLLGVCHLPHLQKLTLSLPFVSIRPANTYGRTGLQHILELHSSALRELTMTFQQSDKYNRPPTPIEWQSMGHLWVAFPHLEFLNIDLRYFGRLSRIILYLQRFNSLTHLVLRNKKFLYEEVETVMSAVGSGLIRLGIEVKCLSPELLDLMATKLPNLDRLDLLFDELGSPTFRKPMIGMLHSPWNLCADWKLRHLNAQTMMQYQSDDMPHCQAMIAAALPCLETLDVSRTR